MEEEVCREVRHAQAEYSAVAGGGASSYRTASKQERVDDWMVEENREHALSEIRVSEKVLRL